MSHGGAPRGRSVNPDVVRAIAGLRAGDVLSAGQAAFFDRVAQHQDEIGPLAIATGIALAAAGSLIWVTRRAAPFSWGEAPSPSLAFDYVLLLGLLLVAADLAYVEMQFTVLGAHWAYHLLIVGVVGLVAAYIALVRLLFEPFRYGQHADSIPLLLAALLGSAVLALIFWAHRRMRER